MMISRGIEISIAGGGGEMVRGPISLSFFSFFLFLFFSYHGFIVSKVQKASCSASYGENKTYESKQITKERHGTG